MLADDLGFADLGCYGSEIDTPHLDALAQRGLRLTNFHSAPMCSPTRAALLTGLESAPRRLRHRRAHRPRLPRLRDGARTGRGDDRRDPARPTGYATMMVGKWHLAKDSDCSAAGPQHSWPCQRGFDRYYGILDAFTNLHHPHRIVEDNHLVEVDQYPDDYYFTDDLTDHAISMIRERKASQPRASRSSSTSRTARCTRRCTPSPTTSRSTAAATTAAGTRCGPSGSPASRSSASSPTGLELAAAQHRAEPRRPGLGRPRRRRAARCSPATWRCSRAWSTTSTRTSVAWSTALEELGELDNTSSCSSSDNGASREGEVVGTSAYYVHLLQGDDIDADFARIDDIGGPQTTPHYPRGWAMASEHPVPALQDQHAPGRPLGAVLLLVARPVSPSVGHAPHASTRTSPTCCRRCSTSSASTGRRTQRRRSSRRSPARASRPMLDDPTAPSTHPEQHLRDATATAATTATGGRS